MTDRTQTAPPYGHVAWAYDLLASAYSLGAIDRAKRRHHHLVKPGDRVLYAGAGRGQNLVPLVLAHQVVVAVCPL
ncbi:MAG: hypothetical protein AAF085_16480, partial [Planctomycetota bacterium]